MGVTRLGWDVMVVTVVSDVTEECTMDRRETYI